MTSCGFVALIGAPNSGKSTLINALVGAKVSIVSRKAQTTRAQIRGIAIRGEAQIIFVDTPGLFAPKRRLDRAMVASAWSAGGDADVVALLIDAREARAGGRAADRLAKAREANEGGPTGEESVVAGGFLVEQTETILEGLKKTSAPCVLIINKIDLVERSELLALAQRLNERRPFVDTFMISATTGDGLDHLADRLALMMKPGPWLYPEDQVSDAPLRALAAEITREKLFERLHDELPYQSTVETDSWTEQRNGSVRIEQTIFVSRDSHKKIVIGEGGRTIKAIGVAARKEIAEANEGPVSLFLFVKVRERWTEDPERYAAMGLEFPKE
jgi:GTP-binding protein Era